MPSLPVDKELLGKWSAGEVLRAKVSKMRNPKFHRKYFALLQVMLDGQEKYTNPEDLLTEVKIRIGHYSEHITAQGELVYVPRSISFVNCDELEFESIYSKTLDVALKNVLPNWTKDEVEAHVSRILGFL